MGVEDKQVAMQVRREVVRRRMDASRINIHVAGGHVELGGIVRPLEKSSNLDIEHELHVIRDRCMRMPNVREVTWKYLRIAL